jgi:hypothetical protein
VFINEEEAKKYGVEVPKEEGEFDMSKKNM